jgi:hypothetical protein
MVEGGGRQAEGRTRLVLVPALTGQGGFAVLADEN